MSLPLLVKWPSRARQALLLERLPLWAADRDARFLFTFDRDDNGVTPDFLAEVNRLTEGRAKIRIGNCRGKVEACNDGLAEERWAGRVILASDDMIPVAPHYGRLIRALFADRFPDGDGVLHLNDGRNGKRLNTLCVCDRRYFDRFGTLYHSDYRSLWCDNEWQEVSEGLGRAAYVDDVIIRHDWIGDGPHADALHRRNESYFQRDCEVYRVRKAAGFPREPVPGVL